MQIEGLVPGKKIVTQYQSAHYQDYSPVGTNDELDGREVSGK